MFRLPLLRSRAAPPRNAGAPRLRSVENLPRSIRARPRDGSLRSVSDRADTEMRVFALRAPSQGFLMPSTTVTRSIPSSTLRPPTAERPNRPRKRPGNSLSALSAYLQLREGRHWWTSRPYHPDFGCLRQVNGYQRAAILNPVEAFSSGSRRESKPKSTRRPRTGTYWDSWGTDPV